MCLILFAIQQHKDYPLIVIANRDEFYARPTKAAHWWQDAPRIYAGRDLDAQGTWMGVDRRGRFAAVTNVREAGVKAETARSRGELPAGFLKSELTAQQYLLRLQPEQQAYSGFNLLLFDSSGCWFTSNRDAGIRKIDAGVYGVSNGAFDEPWPKLATGKAALKHCLQGELHEQDLFAILQDKNPVSDDSLPSTGVTREYERLLSSRFIHSREYGTRACSVLLFSSQKTVRFSEQNFDVDGPVDAQSVETIAID